MSSRPGRLTPWLSVNVQGGASGLLGWAGLGTRGPWEERASLRGADLAGTPSGHTPSPTAWQRLQGTWSLPRTVGPSPGDLRVREDDESHPAPTSTCTDIQPGGRLEAQRTDGGQTLEIPEVPALPSCCLSRRLGASALAGGVDLTETREGLGQTGARTGGRATPLRRMSLGGFGAKLH